MRVRRFPATASGRLSMAALAIAMPFAMAFIIGSESDDVSVQQEVLRIEISLKEFAFVPETVHIPAGRPVTLVDDHGDDAGDAEAEHGTMVLAQVGETMSLSFTLPESRRGVWSAGCFLPGHFEAGMRAVLIVE